MDQRLLEVAKLGDIDALRSILGDDPLILERVALVPSAESPVHVASRLRKTGFLEEIVRLAPNLARDMMHPNQDGLTPLHIASGLGYLDVVKVLLPIGSEGLCLLGDGEGRSPLHVAVVKGKVEVIKELLSSCYEALGEVTSQGETAFHLAVKYKQIEVLKVLLEATTSRKDRSLLNVENKDGCTIFELAKKTNDPHVLDLLKDKSPTHFQTFARYIIRKCRRMFAYEENAFVVVAVLIATVTYQAVLAPPPTIWKENMDIDYKCLSPFSYPFYKIQPVHCRGQRFYGFMIFNTSGFVSSVVVLFFFKTRTCGRMLMALSLVSVVFSYFSLLSAMSPTMVWLGIAFSFLLVLNIVIVKLYTEWIVPQLLVKLDQKTSIKRTTTTTTKKSEMTPSDKAETEAEAEDSSVA